MIAGFCFDIQILSVDDISRKMHCDGEIAVKLILKAGGDGEFVLEDDWLNFLRSISKIMSAKKLRGNRGIIVGVRDDFKCKYCGSERDLTFDHVIPKSKGGNDKYQNIVLACNSCNHLKDNLSVEEFLEKLERLKRAKIRHRPLSTSLADMLKAKGMAIPSN